MMTPSQLERFLKKVHIDTSTGCWEWTGKSFSHGYGVIYTPSVTRPSKTTFKRLSYVHRVSFEEFRGSIKKGLFVHHECKNKICVNPWHCEQITAGDHARLHKTKTHCIRGHALTESNAPVSTSGQRHCLACGKMANNAKYYPDERCVPRYPEFREEFVVAAADIAIGRLVVDEHLAMLSLRQREIIEGRFGLNGLVEETLEDIGNRLGVTRERIRQLETESLAIMRFSKTSQSSG